MRKCWLIAFAVVLGLVAVGCGSEATATKDEQYMFEHPDKTPPPEAGGPPRDGRQTQTPGAPTGANDPRILGAPPGARTK